MPLGNATFQITTSVGRQLQTYDLRKGLKLTFLSSPQTPRLITATHAYKDKVFVAWGGGEQEARNGLWIFKRGKRLDEIDLPDNACNIKRIQLFGPWLIGGGDQKIEIWKRSNSSYEYYTTLRPSATGPDLCHAVLSGPIVTMPTYLNKILVGRTDGIVEVWNVAVGKCVYSISPPSLRSGSVTALQPTPALSNVAIAYSDGALIIHDIQVDEAILSFRNAALPITSISFRTDGLGAGHDGREDGVMATASIRSGDIVLWDLNDGGRVAGTLRSAHEVTTEKVSGITGLEFLPGQSVLVSTGLDNAVRTWIFDQDPFSPVPRQLHARSGHSAAVTCLQFLPASSDGSEAAGKWLLSASQGRDLWCFSLRRDGQSSELSQGNVKHKAKKIGHLRDVSTTIESLKAPPITQMACSLNRDGGMAAIAGNVWQNKRSADATESTAIGWESIVTAHKDDSMARTWFWGRKRAGRWTLKTGDSRYVSSVAMTACGTFALVGSAGGALDMFNLQSGIRRQQFPPKLNFAQTKSLQLQSPQERSNNTAIGHQERITGITVDGLNQYVVSCSIDRSIRFWDFATGVEVHRIQLPNSSPTALRYNTNSGLISLACDDCAIRLIDLETRRLVRELNGCTDQITDHCFSHDGRWIVCSASDSVIRVFDLASGHLIDAFKTSQCIGLAFSFTGEFLATCHEGLKGINIWSNKALFSPMPMRPVEGIVDLTDAAVFEEVGSSLFTQEDSISAWHPNDKEVEQIDQLSSDLVTLSLTPRTKWQTLLHLDDIRARNKPTEPVKAPQKAPFFLSSALQAPSQQQNSIADSQSHSVPAASQDISKVQHGVSGSKSHFSELLRQFEMQLDPDAAGCIGHLASLNPSQMDLEIRSLQLSELVPFVASLTARLKCRRDFELVNTFMACFLRLHGDVISETDSADLKVEVAQWHIAMRQEEERLGHLIGYCRGVVEFLRSAR